MQMVPHSTCKWDIPSLQQVGVYYKDNPVSLSGLFGLVNGQLGLFNPLNNEQLKKVKSIQESMVFSIDMNQMMAQCAPGWEERHLSLVHAIQDGFKQDVKKEYDNDISDSLVKVDEFISDIIMTIKETIQQRMLGKNVPEATFVDLFKSFAKICPGIIVRSGAAWKTSALILQQPVISEPDAVIFAGNVYDADPLKAVSVVSIVEVKNIGQRHAPTESTRTRHRQTTSSSESSVSSACSEKPICNDPWIFRRIRKSVLGQHGGDLLVHTGTFGRKFHNMQLRLHPGMIVVGTEITFTLLEYNYNHAIEINDNTENEYGRSYIYYTEPKDILKKEDRDELLESFVRLGNVSVS